MPEFNSDIPKIFKAVSFKVLLLNYSRLQSVIIGGNRRSKSLIINEIYRLYILLETALKSTSCATVIFSSSNVQQL
jgi:hypothetical protein